MKSKIRNSLSYTLVVLLLIIGLGISSIGVTYSRYQKETQRVVHFMIKGPSTVYITDTTRQWNLDSTNTLLTLDFSVTNTITRAIPESNSSFYYRFKATVEGNVNLVMIQPNGSEIIYTGQKISDSEGFIEYQFIDETGKELIVELAGNRVSTSKFRLEISGVDEAFMSELKVIDASYDVETQNTYAISQSNPLVVDSNFLSTTEENIILLDESIDLDIMINKDMNSKIICKSNSSNLIATIDGYTELELPLLSHQLYTVNLSVLKYEVEIPSMETVTVEWQLLDSYGNIIEVYKANFLVHVGPLEEQTEEPTITMEYVNDDKTFSKRRPLQLYLTSNIDTNIELREAPFPFYTRYSLDEGKTWYVLSQSEGIDIPLQANIKQKVMIDFSKTNMVFDNKTFDIYAYFNNKLINTLQMNMKDEDYVLLEVLNSSMGIINHQALSFTVNLDPVEELMITLEYLQDGSYQEIDKDMYLIWNTTDNLSYQITTNDQEIPNGTYRIKLQQIYNQQVIKEETLTFFALDEGI